MILTHFAAPARRVLGVWLLLVAGVGIAGAQTVPPAAPRWMSVPTSKGHLTAPDIGLVINTADPYSVEVGAHYIAARKLKPAQVLRVELPPGDVLQVGDFRRLDSQINAFFGPATQALAIAWKIPYVVGACNSLTGALTLGYDDGLCSNSCRPSRLSSYFNSASARPFSDLRLRPSMMLAAQDVAGAVAMIDRGVKSDRSLAFRGGPPVNVYLMRTSDSVRSVRAATYPPAGLAARVGIDVHVESADRLDAPKRVLLYETGLTRVEGLDGIDWVPGALADHLTSYGGALAGVPGQMSVLEWIASGATATYGTVSEPCAHPQKFPHPQVLLLHYVQGETAIEAYWKSVAWPQQGAFVGEPLASPFAR